MVRQGEKHRKRELRSWIRQEMGARRMVGLSDLIPAAVVLATWDLVGWSPLWAAFPQAAMAAAALAVAVISAAARSSMQSLTKSLLVSASDDHPPTRTSIAWWLLVLWVAVLVGASSLTGGREPDRYGMPMDVAALCPIVVASVVWRRIWHRRDGRRVLALAGLEPPRSIGSRRRELMSAARRRIVPVLLLAAVWGGFITAQWHLFDPGYKAGGRAEQVWSVARPALVAQVACVGILLTIFSARWCALSAFIRYMPHLPGTGFAVPVITAPTAPIEARPASAPESAPE